MKIRTIIYLLIFIIALFLYNFNYQGFTVQNENIVVTNVIDGDTIVVSGGERVRLLGIDTPEKGEFFYKEAKARMEQLVENKEATLEKEGDNKDKYDRLLRYIFVNGTNINLKMVEEGYAICYFYEQSKYQEECRYLEEQARVEGIRRWQKEQI